MWLLTPKPGTGGVFRTSCRNAWMCRSFQRNESAFNSGKLHWIRKAFSSFQAENEQLLAYLQLYPSVCQCMGKRRWLEEKLTPTQGEAKQFVFITKTHRKKKNAKHKTAQSQRWNSHSVEDCWRVSVCFYPSALRSAWIYVNTINRAVPKHLMPDNL